MATLHTDRFVRKIHRLLLGVSPQSVRASSRLGEGDMDRTTPQFSIHYFLCSMLTSRQNLSVSHHPSGVCQAGKLPAGPVVKSSLD